MFRVFSYDDRIKMVGVLPTCLMYHHSFLANRYVVIHPSSVCNVCAPDSGDWNFWQWFCAIWYVGQWPSADIQVKFYRLSQGNPSVGGVKHLRGNEYTDFGLIECYKSEMVQDRS